MLRLPRKLQLLLWKRRKSIAPATQTDMTTCLETFEKEFCSFPHRHGDATGKPETRDETRGRSKASISCETSHNFDTFGTLSNRLECHKVPRLPSKTTWQPAWKPSKRKVFAASPKEHGEATGKPETRDETRGSIKTSISCETSSNFLVNLQICYLKIDVSREASVNLHHILQNATPATDFAPCRHLTQPRQCDSQKHATRHVYAAPATQNEDGHVQSAAPTTRTATHLLKTSQKYCACHTKRLSTRYRTRLNVTKRHGCHAKRSNATCATSKSNPFCRTYCIYGHCHTGLARTVTNGCGRLGNVERNTLNP